MDAPHWAAELRRVSLRCRSARPKAPQGRTAISRFLSIVRIGLLCTISASSTTWAQQQSQTAPPKLDESVALTVRPYAIMACDAYSTCSQGDLTNTGYKKEDFSWQDAIRQPGSVGIIPLYKKAGFDATIFRNDQKKEIVIAYTGTEGGLLGIPQYELAKLQEKLGFGSKELLEGDWPTNLRALDLKTPSARLEAQYVAARSLASRLAEKYSTTPYKDYKLTLVGHSLGGALASYAGQHVNANVYTFDPARNVLAGTGANARQINIIATGDPFSDPTARTPMKTGTIQYLPGRTYRVDLPRPSTIAALDPIAKHYIEPLVSRINSLAGILPTAASPPPLPKAQWNPSPSQGASSPTSSHPRNTFAYQAPAAPTQNPSTVAPVKTPSFSQSGISSKPVTTYPQSAMVSPAPRGSVSGSQVRVGGISLSKAAAERMPLNITLDGSYYSDGRVVLMGKSDPAHSIDAALFLTSMRLACESVDPYFSLDPVDGAAWNTEGQEATEAFWKRVASDFTRRPDGKNIKKPSVFSIRTISARRDYPKLWASLEGSYPNLKSKLVFRPTWLAQTRFGEILYKADVLLKELSGGVSVLEPGPLRASKIDNYVSASARSATEGLLAGYKGKASAVKPVWRGHRLWFDLTSFQPRTARSYIEPPNIVPAEIAVDTKRRRDSELHKILAARNLLPEFAPVANRTLIAADGNALDLSGVFPRMFVRRHDYATNSDLSGSDPALDSLSADVNRYTAAYASAYKELHALTEVFRAYVAAVYITRGDPSICANVRPQPLLAGERVARQLPVYHPTELFITLAGYEFSAGKYRRLLTNRASSLNGGVAIRARAYLEDFAEGGEAYRNHATAEYRECNCAGRCSMASKGPPIRCSQFESQR